MANQEWQDKTLYETYNDLQLFNNCYASCESSSDTEDDDASVLSQLKLFTRIMTYRQDIFKKALSSGIIRKRKREEVSEYSYKRCKCGIRIGIHRQACGKFGCDNEDILHSQSSESSVLLI